MSIFDSPFHPDRAVTKGIVLRWGQHETEGGEIERHFTLQDPNGNEVVVACGLDSCPGATFADVGDEVCYIQDPTNDHTTEIELVAAVNAATVNTSSRS